MYTEKVPDSAFAVGPTEQMEVVQDVVKMLFVAVQFPFYNFVLPVHFYLPVVDLLRRIRNAKNQNNFAKKMFQFILDWLFRPPEVFEDLPESPPPAEPTVFESKRGLWILFDDNGDEF